MDGSVGNKVYEIAATSRAFCAVRGDQSLVVWGNDDYGGTLSAAKQARVADQTQRV
jgi:hypothetical protein